MAKRQRWRAPPPKPDAIYVAIWREAEEALWAVFQQHPEYFTEAGRRAARVSICKRVTGRLCGVLRRHGLPPALPPD